MTPESVQKSQRNETVRHHHLVYFTWSGVHCSSQKSSSEQSWTGGVCATVSRNKFGNTARSEGQCPAHSDWHQTSAEDGERIEEDCQEHPGGEHGAWEQEHCQEIRGEVQGTSSILSLGWIMWTLSSFQFQLKTNSWTTIETFTKSDYSVASKFIYLYLFLDVKIGS